jgi:uncharacterized membrane protein (UPF0136 family)
MAAWLYRNRWAIFIVLAALAVRLHWNLLVHPLGDYQSSDMRGYTSRAEQMVANFGKAYEYHGFFPYGTHFMLALLKAIFGKDNYTAIGVVYALIGATTVLYGMKIAALVTRRKWLPTALGVLLIFYYPLISLGGYTLSEAPFGMFMLFSTYRLLLLVRDGRDRDAWLTGVWAAVASAFRPQLLLSVAVFGLVWLVMRKTMTKVRLKHLVLAGIPLGIMLVFSSARLYHHTGRFGLVSENGRFNQLFGRCHNKKAVATPDEPGRGRIRFGPPPLIQLEKRAKTHPDSWVQLEPAIGAELSYTGYISDVKPLRELVSRCVQKTGLLGQAKYAVVNTLMLWAYNTPWPDSGRDLWRRTASNWQAVYTTLIAVPAVLMAFTCFFKKTCERHGILGLHVWAILVTAAIYFGDTRLRTPYDPMLLLLAFELYLFVGGLLWTRAKAAWQRRRAARG